MILGQVKFKGLVVYPYQIKNNKCYYFKNGTVIDYPYRLAGKPNYYVAGEGLYMDSSTTSVDVPNEKMVLSSYYVFSVDGETLKIK